MGEIQEKVWVVMSSALVLGVGGVKVPSRARPKLIKVYDDRSDAREFAKRMNERFALCKYTVAGVKKG